MKNIKLLVIITTILSISLLLTFCYGPNENNPVTPKSGNGTVQGKVFDNNGFGISGVVITCGSAQTVSGPDGKFTLTKAPEGNRQLLNFTKENFASNQKILPIIGKKTMYIEAALYPIGDVKSVNNTGTAFNIVTTGASVDFQASSLVDSKGNSYTGQATIKLTYFDPTSSKFFDVFPGEFMGIEENGDLTNIESFGFIDVEMWAGTEKLQLAEGKPATITMSIPAKLSAKAPATIPLWNYDTQKGQWIEIGEATKQSNKYIGSVKHFSKINLDLKYEELCQVIGRVVDQDGNRLANAWIKLVGIDFTGGGNGYCDENGEFEFVRVKGAANVRLTASYMGFYSLPLDITTGGNGSTTDAGNIVITIDNNLFSGWSDISNAIAKGITDMQFVNSTTGWIIANGIYKTEDGGATWMIQLESGNGKDSIFISSIFMIDENNGWACGSKLYHTSNGGLVWDEVDFNGGKQTYLNDIFFVNQNVGWVVGYELWKTTDGGTTWVQLPGMGKQQYVQKVFFTDENTGYARTYVGVVKTTDGGNSWDSLQLQQTHTYGAGTIYFTDPNTGWISFGGERDAAKLYFTNDGGLTFVDKTPETDSGINDVFFINANEGWVCGNAGSVFHTTDGGTTWKRQYVKFNGSLTKIWFIDNLKGWTAGSIGNNKPALFYTETGGEPLQ